MGNKVRYDGQHRLNDKVARYIQPHTQLLPLCPESMAGMGIPRPPVNLIQSNIGIQAQGRDDRSLFVTNRLKQMARVVANSYPNLKGFICQSRSPSCGFGTTPIYDSSQKQIISTQGNGLFMGTLQELLPDLIIVNETELNPDRAQQFLEKLKH